MIGDWYVCVYVFRSIACQITRSIVHTSCDKLLFDIILVAPKLQMENFLKRLVHDNDTNTYDWMAKGVSQHILYALYNLFSHSWYDELVNWRIFK